MIEQAILPEAVIRLSFFVVLFLAFALLEHRFPKKQRSTSKSIRWRNNLAIILGNTLVLRGLFWLVGTTAVGVALLVESKGLGLLNQWNTSGPLTFLIGFLIMDFVIYAQHVMMHRIKPLWRLHRMHHADTDIDVSTGLRFHPLEIIISMGIKFAVILVFGISPLVVIIFEVVLNATSMFNHANWSLPPRLDAVLRLVLVTPDMHRVHHSVHTEELNNNFGFNLPWWDRLCRTYKAQPKDGHQDMLIGLNDFRAEKYLSPAAMLAIPFVSGREMDDDSGGSA